MPDTIRLARLTLRWVASGDLYEANLRNNNHRPTDLRLVYPVGVSLRKYSIVSAIFVVMIESSLGYFAVAFRLSPIHRATLFLWWKNARAIPTVTVGKCFQRRGEATLVRALEPYLVNSRAVDRARVIVIDGGYVNCGRRTLWIVRGGRVRHSIANSSTEGYSGTKRPNQET